MKNKIMVIVLSTMVTMGVTAQGYPVMDISSIATAVQNGYTMLQSLQAMYASLQAQYDQLQQQIKNFEGFDLNALDARDPLGAWQSMSTYADRMRTYEENIQALINKKDYKIGNISYSLNDIFTNYSDSINNFVTHYSDSLNDMYKTYSGAIQSAIPDPLEVMLTLQEKEIFHKKFGMSYGNYVRINQLGEMLQKKSAEVAGYSDNLRKNLSEDREHLSAITKDLLTSESTIQHQQMNNAIMSIMAQDIKTQANLLGDIAQQLSMSSSQTVLEKKAMLDEININKIDISEGLIKMLNEMPPVDRYK